MYPIPQSQLTSTSGFVPRPSSTFQPIAPAAPIPVLPATAAVSQTKQPSTGSSAGSSIPCGQGTPKDPAGPTPQGTPQYFQNSPQVNTHVQNVAPQQPPAQVQQHFQQ